MARAKVAAVLALVLAGVSAGAVTAADACQAPTGPADPPAVRGGDASLSAAQPGPAPAVAPVLCWTGQAGNALLGTDVVALGDLVVTLSDSNEVVAFPPDGSEAYRISLGANVVGQPGGLTTDGERVYAAGPTGLSALSGSDGSRLWEVPVTVGGISGETGAFDPVVAAGRVFVVLNTAGQEKRIERWLMAFDGDTGEELWRRALYETLPAGPPSADAAVVAIWDGIGSLITYDAATGERRWELTVEDLGVAPTGPISFDDQRLMVNVAGGGVIGLSIADGSRLWEFLPEAGITAATTLQGDTLFVNGVTQLYAVDAATGSMRWSAPIQDRVSPFPYEPVPALADGLVILGTTDPTANSALVAIDAETGQEMWRTTTGIYGAMLSPVSTGGRVYVAAFDINQDGGLFAFGASAGS